MVELNPHRLAPFEFAKVCGCMIGIFFGLMLITGLISGKAGNRPARFLCGFTCVYFVVTTSFMMYGMIVSFEVARSKFDKYNY
jgi:hypothetical protein